MSRWAEDPERAADALIARSLEELGLAGRLLLVNPGAGLPPRIAALGLAYVVWNRRLTAPGEALPWPPAGPFDAALVRLPKARDEQLMTAHAVLAALAIGGRLVLYGGNDEGIKSAAGMLQEIAGAVETVAVRGHGRVLSARSLEDAKELRGSLEAWRAVAPLELQGITRAWVTYPGTFAAGRLDEGTALLLGVLPPLAAGDRALDYGCGSGVIGAAVLSGAPDIALTMLDNDAVALEAVRENVPGATRVLGTRITDAGQTPYQAIISNPPLHRGIAEDHGLLEQLIADAPVLLVPGGILQMVVQRRVPLDRLLAEHFARVDIAAENGRFRVWRAERA
jgi:16S rRNA (guanine1207-N2)-methyltransferase